MMSPSGGPPRSPAPGAVPAGLPRGTAFGHGKVILTGEHAVVFGQPALAAGLSRGVTATAVEGTGRLTIPAWEVSIAAGDGSPVGQAFAAILARLAARDIDVAVDAGLPARAGLGSSAALAIAVARAVASARDRDDDTARAAAGDAETVFHGTPSGIDLAAAGSGEVGRFQRPHGWRPLAVLQPMPLCIGLSGRARDTRGQVDAVRRLRERTPAAASVIETMGALADPTERALAAGDIDELGRLFDLAHGLLCALRVSSPELDTLVHAARAAGAIGAKLTGAGGGGAIIALAPGHERDVLERWKSSGFDGFVATIGGPAGAEP
jgi:mevalonate kinase